MEGVGQFPAYPEVDEAMRNILASLEARDEAARIAQQAPAEVAALPAVVLEDDPELEMAAVWEQQQQLQMQEEQQREEAAEAVRCIPQTPAVKRTAENCFQFNQPVLEDAEAPPPEEDHETIINGRTVKFRTKMEDGKRRIISFETAAPDAATASAVSIGGDLQDVSKQEQQMKQIRGTDLRRSNRAVARTARIPGILSQVEDDTRVDGCTFSNSYRHPSLRVSKTTDEIPGVLKEEVLDLMSSGIGPFFSSTAWKSHEVVRGFLIDAIALFIEFGRPTLHRRSEEKVLRLIADLRRRNPESFNPHVEPPYRLRNNKALDKVLRDEKRLDRQQNK